MRSSGCLTSSRVQFSMYTLPCTMSCPSMRKFRRVSEGAVSGTLIKTSAGLGFDAFVVTRRPRRLEGGGGEAFGIRLSTSSLSELLPAIVILLDLKSPRSISSSKSCVPST